MSVKEAYRKVLVKRREEIVKGLGSYQEGLRGKSLNELVGVIGNRRIVAGYYPMRNEFDCKFVLLYLIRLGFRVALPCVGESKLLEFREWDGDDGKLRDGKFGVKEPGIEFESVRPEAILVPMLGFNLEFYRLGYGGGYYDVTLKEYSECISIGLAFSQQLCIDLPISNHDIPLSHLFTERGFLNK